MSRRHLHLSVTGLTKQADTDTAMKAGAWGVAFLFKCPLMSQWILFRRGHAFPAGILSFVCYLEMPFSVVLILFYASLAPAPGGPGAAPCVRAS